MTKSKFKILLLIVTMVTLISTLSFATSEEPVTTSLENDLTINSEDNNEDAIVEENEELDTTDTKSDWINSDLYKVGDKVEIKEIVDGNAFICANEVTISGEIGGDVFVIANKINITGGYVYSGLFAVANEITVNGIVYDAYIIANNFTLEKDGYVYRDLKVSASTINIDGIVRRDAYLTGMNINLNKENGTLIGNNLEYSSNSEIDIPENAVQGEVKFNKETIKEESVGEVISSYIFDVINVLIYSLVVILLAIWLAPKFVERVSTMGTKKAFASLGIGILAPIVAIIALFILLISTVCAQVAVAGTLVFMAICMSGLAFTSIYFGSLFNKLVKWEGKVKLVISTEIIALILWAICKIPYIGGFIGFLATVFGIGILLVNMVYRKETVKEETPVVEEKTEE